MIFIFPDCLDYIDPGYDFRTDTFAPGRTPYWDDQFPHEFMDSPPYDGVLVSRAIVGDHLYSGKYTESQGQRFRLIGARAFLRYEEADYPGSLVFGDCGAFQYHDLEVPPYTPDDMLEFYDDGMFTHGCSVDHIIFEMDSVYDQGKAVPDEYVRRQAITLQNAEQFLKGAAPMRKYFQPLGVVQGWSPESMANMAEDLVKMGYDYLALGGLVPVGVADIHKVLDAVRRKVPYDTKIHILGFAKANHLHEFLRYNITSIDTTSPLIRAFKDGRQNYWTQEGNNVGHYTAIKVPQVHANNSLKNMIRMGVFTQEYVIEKEQEALRTLWAYGAGKLDIESALEAVRDYTRISLWTDKADDTTLDRKTDRLMDLYRDTLYSRPWERCNCRVCREVGVDAVIFRSSNRNKRRGIHNLYIFNNYLKNVLARHK